jgi:hypothetical protein
MVRVCCYCQREYGGKCSLAPDAVSHGICPLCFPFVMVSYTGPLPTCPFNGGLYELVGACLTECGVPFDLAEGGGCFQVDGRLTIRHRRLVLRKGGTTDIHVDSGAIICTLHGNSTGCRTYTVGKFVDACSLTRLEGACPLG